MKKTVKIGLMLLAAAALILTIFAGCDTDKNSPESLVKSFVSDINKKSLSDDAYGDLLSSHFAPGTAGWLKPGDLWKTYFALHDTYAISISQSSDTKVTGVLTGTRNSISVTYNVTFSIKKISSQYYLTGMSGFGIGI